MRTPLNRVRGWGSAHAGTEHFWRIRLTSVALIPLCVALIAVALAASHADYATARALLAAPWVALPLFLLVVATVIHMRLGMEEIIVDYVHDEGARIACLILNSFFCWTLGFICAFALLKLTLGG